MTKEELAAQLSGIEYPCRIDKALIAQAKAAGLVIIYGASDDLMEFDGAFRDEVGCYNGGQAKVDALGVLDRDQVDDDDDEAIADYVTRSRTAQSIEALWHDGMSDASVPAWTYMTDIPHATFDVMDDGELYCRGIVLALADLRQEPPQAPGNTTEADTAHRRPNPAHGAPKPKGHNPVA